MSKPRSAKGVLKAARRLITESGWIQGNLWQTDATGEKTAFCALGALQEVDTPYELEAKKYLIRAIRATKGGIFQRYVDLPSNEIWRFNDHFTTEKEDVIAVFDAAIEIASSKK